MQDDLHPLLPHRLRDEGILPAPTWIDMTCYLLILTLAAHTTILPVCWEQEPAVYVDSEIAWRVG